MNVRPKLSQVYGVLAIGLSPLVPPPFAPAAHAQAPAQASQFTSQELASRTVYRRAVDAVVRFSLTTQLVLDDYMARLANHLVATTAALVVGKAALPANMLPIARRFDTEPLLFKTVVYTVIVFLVRAVEY